MGERNQDSASTEPMDDLFEPMIGEFSEEELRTEFRDFCSLETSLRAGGKVLAILAHKP